MASVVLPAPLVTFCSGEQGGYWDTLASSLDCISIWILYNEGPNPSAITCALITLCSPQIALIAFASAGVALCDEQYFICKQRRHISGTRGGRNQICCSTALQWGMVQHPDWRNRFSGIRRNKSYFYRFLVVSCFWGPVKCDSSLLIF